MIYECNHEKKSWNVAVSIADEGNQFIFGFKGSKEKIELKINEAYCHVDCYWPQIINFWIYRIELSNNKENDWQKEKLVISWKKKKKKKKKKRNTEFIIKHWDGDDPLACFVIFAVCDGNEWEEKD